MCSRPHSQAPAEKLAKTQQQSPRLDRVEEEHIDRVAGDDRPVSSAAGLVASRRPPSS